MKRVRSSQQLRSALGRKGFLPKQADHTWYRFYSGGRKTNIRTRVSHGTKTYDIRLLGMMADQLHLDHNEFDDLIECPMSGDDYANLMAQRGQL